MQFFTLNLTLTAMETETLSALVQTDFELTTTASLTEEQLIAALAERIDEMLKHRIEVLMSTLYRLDVSERKVDAAMQPDAVLPPNVGIAALIVARQKERLRTKALYKADRFYDLDEV
jgi:hypothetical protein